MKSTIIAATLAILVLGGCSSPPDAPTADNSEVTSTGCQPLTDDQLNIIQSGVIPAATDAISLTRGAWLPLPAEYGALGHTKITVVEMKFVDDTEMAEATLAANDDLSLIMPINPMAITFFDWAAAMTEEEGSPINQYVAGIAASDVASAVTDCLERE